MYRLLLSGLMLSASCFVSSSFAADSISQDSFEERTSGRAVDGVNAKISIGYASYDFNDIVLPFAGPAPNADLDGFFVEGSVSAPIGDNFGFQLDGIYGSANDDLDLDFTGVGAHLFWRDPSLGLLGVYGHFKEYGDIVDSYNISAEAEIYKDNFTLELLAGVDNVDTDFGDDDFFAGEAILAYYPEDNLRLDFGVIHNIDNTQFAVGAEIMKDTDTGFAPSLFVDATFGEDDTSYVGGGLRLYFGNSAKSLKQRHREDDPKFRLNDNTAAIGTCLNNAETSSFGPATIMGGLDLGGGSMDAARLNQTASSSSHIQNAIIGVPPVVRPTFEGCNLNFPARARYDPYDRD